MKILLLALNHAPEKTGIGKFQGEMAAWLAARGHQVRAVTAPPYYPAWKVEDGYSARRYRRETITGVDIHRVPLYVPAAPTGIKRLLHLLSFAISSLPVLLWQAVRWQPDAVIATAPPLLAAPGALLAAGLCGAKAVLHIQDFEVDAAFGLGLLKPGLASRLALAFEGWLLRAFPLVTTISPRMRERLIAKGVPPERAVLVPNWAGVEDFDPAHAATAGPQRWRAKLLSGDATILALYSGNLGRKQGVETLVDVARLLHADPRIHIAICGDGAARREMEDSARGLINLTFLPLQDNKGFVDLMMAADIHLMPQRAEAADLVMPSKLGNILASGGALVAGAGTDTQVYDAVQGCGIAVPPGDARAFAEALVNLADNAPMRARMGAEGRKRALSDLSRDGILMRLEGLLSKGESK